MYWPIIGHLKELPKVVVVVVKIVNMNIRTIERKCLLINTYDQCVCKKLDYSTIIIIINKTRA